MMPDAEKTATATSAKALTAATIGVIEYASDKITRIHDQREVNVRITRSPRRLRRTAATD